MVSILIAARNEEQNIIRCLQAIDSQDYPKDKLDVLIGDDDSGDGTAALAQGFIEGRPHFRLLPIRLQIAGLRGKTNVLAQLARQATGDFFLVTDADVCVPPTWVRGMLAEFAPQTGVVSGVTRCGSPPPTAGPESCRAVHPAAGRRCRSSRQRRMGPPR